MATVNIDGKEFNTDEMSDNAQKQVASLGFVQSELKRLEGQIAVYKTAEIGYLNALKNELPDI
tara:strand:- start:11905 stop:12093 length:189 start_codon:yes stop_codon:yes gene_type:complete